MRKSLTIFFKSNIAFSILVFKNLPTENSDISQTFQYLATKPLRLTKLRMPYSAILMNFSIFKLVLKRKRSIVAAIKHKQPRVVVEYGAKSCLLLQQAISCVWTTHKFFDKEARLWRHKFKLQNMNIFYFLKFKNCYCGRYFYKIIFVFAHAFIPECTVIHFGSNKF